MDLLSSFADQMEQVSVDEAYLDVSLKCQSEDHDTSLRHALAQARAIKQGVLEECQLTISVGIAGNKLMAKIASDYDKPDGLILIPRKPTRSLFWQRSPSDACPASDRSPSRPFDKRASSASHSFKGSPPT